VEYKRTLSSTEALRHFIYIDRHARKMFPPPGKQFDVVVNKQVLKVSLDIHGRIFALTSLDTLPHLHEGDVIVLAWNNRFLYTLTVEEQG
jgi:hypothetical protein